MMFFKKQHQPPVEDIDVTAIRERVRAMIGDAAGRPADLAGLFALMGEDERGVFRVLRARTIAGNEAVLPDQIPSSLPLR
jgi:hypothetical protein